MALRALFNILVLVVIVSSSQALRLAKRATQRSSRRSAYGGWALSEISCPSNTTKCSNGQACCPNGLTCFGGAGQFWCCPDRNDCHDQIVALPVCANSEWNLYQGWFNYFCCEPGQVGVYVLAQYGICANSDVPVPASKLASTISQIGGTQSGSPTTTSTINDKATTRVTATTLSTKTSTSPDAINNPKSPVSSAPSPTLASTTSGMITTTTLLFPLSPSLSPTASTTDASVAPSSTDQATPLGTGSKLDQAGQNTVTVVCTVVGVVVAIGVGYWQTREGKQGRKFFAKCLRRRD